MKTSVKERDTSRLLSRTRGVIWIAAFFVCFYPNQGEGLARTVVSFAAFCSAGFEFNDIKV